MRLFFIVALLLISSCRRQAEYDTVFRYPMSEWETQAAKLGDGDLINAYIYGVLRERPPTVLVDSVVKRGPRLLGELIDSVDSHNDSYLSYSVYEVAEAMEYRKKGSVCGSPILLGKNASLTLHKQ